MPACMHAFMHVYDPCTNEFTILRTVFAHLIMCRCACLACLVHVHASKECVLHVPVCIRSLKHVYATHLCKNTRRIIRRKICKNFQSTYRFNRMESAALYMKQVNEILLELLNRSSGQVGGCLLVKKSMTWSNDGSGMCEYDAIFLCTALLACFARPRMHKNCAMVVASRLLNSINCGRSQKNRDECDHGKCKLPSSPRRRLPRPDLCHAVA
jgi:hypothetical protein